MAHSKKVDLFLGIQKYKGLYSLLVNGYSINTSVFCESEETRGTNATNFLAPRKGQCNAQVREETLRVSPTPN